MNPIALEIRVDFQALKSLAASSSSNVEICMAIDALETKVAYYLGEMVPKELVVRPETRWP